MNAAPPVTLRSRSDEGPGPLAEVQGPSLALRMTIGRRQLLRASLAGAAAMALAACGGTAGGPAPASGSAAASPAGGAARPAGSGAASAGGLKLPSYVPFANAPKPDLPSTPEGVDAAYFSFPKTLVKSVPDRPGDGSEVDCLTITTATPPKAMEQNSAWQDINKQLGVTFKMNIISSADLRSRMNALIAGNDLPDLIYNVQANVPAAPDFMKQSLMDLTPYLGGDAIKDYPNLANFPTTAWKGTIFNNAIYAVPVPRAPFGYTMQYRQDLLDQMGLPLPQNGDDLKKILVSYTHPDKKQWGWGVLPSTAFALNYSASSGGNFFPQMFGTANNWKNDGGKLTRAFESEQYKAAVAFVKDLVSAGVVSPDSWTGGGTVASDELHNGTVWTYINSWGAYVQGWDLTWAVNPKAVDYPMAPLSFDGKARPVHHFGPGHFGMTFIKKMPEARVKMLLRVLNFIAAPFGSEESVLLNYGIKDKHYMLDQDGNPTLTKLGVEEANTSWKYITAGAPVLYDIHNSKDFATVSHKVEEAFVPAGVADPTVGLYSKSDSAHGFQLDTDFYSGVQDIVLGRRPASDLDQLVKDWKSKGGDTIRAESQAAWQGSHLSS
jgi:putative aldouronate transport system substrate-binding protein